MDRNQALQLLHSNMQNQNLRRHCYAVEAVMIALYDRLVDGVGNDDEKNNWRIAGLLHDADYELTKEDSANHTKKVIEWLQNTDATTDIRDAIASHAWGFLEDAPRPTTKMGWALYCCDELTGLIVAVALVMPEKKLSSVTVESVMKKWNSSSFAAGVNRKQIEQCTPMLLLPLEEFVGIALSAMQRIHEDLGL